jgi:hypothetical protein
MLNDVRANVGIVVIAVALCLVATWFSRSQVAAGDQSYMRAIIPHHSIAILTSERAHISDVRVRRLADEIITSQRREIKEMDWLIDDISKNGEAEVEANERPVPTFEATP